MTPSPSPRETGRLAVDSLKRSVADRVARALRPEDGGVPSFVDVGLVDRAWLEDPSTGRFSAATPLEVVERYLERSVEQRPSLLATLGLTAIQVLSSDDGDDDHRTGAPADLTVVFTDLEGFTAYTALHGDAAASRLLADHHRAVGPIVRSRGGRVVKRLGDGFLLTFGEPSAAVLACLELVAARTDPLRLRAGIHLGEVLVTRSDVVGHVVNVAARVTEAAGGGQVMATTEVRAAVAPALADVRFGRARPRRFKGVGEQVSICPVTSD